MAIFRRPFLQTLLCASTLLTLTEATVTCTEQTVQAFANPSFETGDMNGWTALRASLAQSGGSVVSGEAADGSYYYTLPASTTWTYLKQTLSDLDTTRSYDLSVDYKITSTLHGSQYFCYVTFAKDSWSGWLAARPQIFPSADPEWTKLSQTWQPTASSHDIYLSFACIMGATLDFDNFQMPIATTSVCSTSTPSPNPSISPSAGTSSDVATNTHATSSQASVGSASPTQLSATSGLSSSIASFRIPSSTTPIASSLHVSSSSSLGRLSSSIVAQRSSSSPSSSSFGFRHPQATPSVSSSLVPSQSAFLSSSYVSSVRISSTVMNQIPSPVLSTSLPSLHLSSQILVGLPSSLVAIQVPPSISILSPASLPTPKDGTQPAGSSNVPSKPTSLSPFGSTLPNGGATVVTGSPPSNTNRPGIPKASETPAALTTSTILSTRTSTITACPSTVVHCPAASRTTFVTTETVVAYTTVCPATETAKAVQATETTSSLFSTRTTTMTSCPDRQQYCALPHRKSQILTETLLVSTTAYLAAVPTSDRRPVFIDDFAISGLSPGPTQIGQSSPGFHREGSGLVGGALEQHPEYQAEVTRTQFVFSTIYVTQTALATVCPSVQKYSTAQTQAPSSSVRPVYF